MDASPLSSVFCLYRDSPERRTALTKAPGAPERYLLFGLDQLAERGISVRHNLERGCPPPAWARVVGQGSKRAAAPGGRVRRRLRLGARLPARRQRRRRGLLDRGHGRHPARPARAGRPRPPADRVHSDRAPGAPRATPRPVDTSPLCECAAPLAHHRRLCRERDGVASRLAWRGRAAGRLHPVRCRRGRVSPAARAPSGRRRRLDRRRSPARLRAGGRRRVAAPRAELPHRRHRGASRPARRAVPERRARDGHRPRAGARPDRGSARGGAARSRQQLLGRDNRPAPGDGHGQTRRRLSHEGDCLGLRPRGRRQLPAGRAR